MPATPKPGPRLRATPILILALAALPVGPPALAALPGAVAGAWGATLRENFTIGGFGSRAFRGDGNCVIAPRDSLSAGLDCQGFPGDIGPRYSGGIHGRPGRPALRWALDDAGLEQVRADMTRWLIAKHRQKGRTLTPGHVYYEIHRVAYPPLRVLKAARRPARVAVTLKGRVVQLVNDRYIIRPYTCRLSIQFLAGAL